MSGAFIKNTDGDDLAGDLPDREISMHPNYVTAAGLAQIEAAIERFQREHVAAQASEDRAAIQRTARELRYWTARRQSAELTEPEANDRIRFGSKVTLRGEDGEQVFRIVGEDEADPVQGTLSCVSPLARALSGKEEGERVQVGAREFEILKME